VSRCRVIEKRLGRYLDGELPPEDRRVVDSHLVTCTRCGEELAEIRRLSGYFQEAFAVPPAPEGMVQRIMARAEIDGSRMAWNSLWFWRDWSLSMRFAAAGVTAAAIYIGLAIGTASLPVSRPAGDEMQWIGLTSRAPLVAAYMERYR
jgi:anti-sigma factor RsiW